MGKALKFAAIESGRETVTLSYENNKLVIYYYIKKWRTTRSSAT